MRVHHVELAVRQELQPQVAHQRQVRQLGLEPVLAHEPSAASRMSGEMSIP